MISDGGIEADQYGAGYNHGDLTKAGWQITANEYSYRVVSKREQWKDFYVRETAGYGAVKFIELVFEYDGLPEGTNTARYAPKKDAEVSEQRAASDMNGTGVIEPHPVENKDEEQAKKRRVSY